MASSRLAMPATAASRSPPALPGPSSLVNPAPPPAPITIMGHEITSLCGPSRFDWSPAQKNQITNFIIDQKITKEQCSRNKKDQIDSARFDPLFTILGFDKFRDLRNGKGEAVRDIVEEKLRTRMWKSWEGNGKVDKVHQEAILSGIHMQGGPEDAALEGVLRRTDQRLVFSGQDIDRGRDVGRRGSAPLNAPSIPLSGLSSQPPQPIQAFQPAQPIQAPQPAPTNQGPSSSDPYRHLSKVEKVKLRDDMVNEENRRRKGKGKKRSYQIGATIHEDIEPHHESRFPDPLPGLRVPNPAPNSAFATGSQSQGQDQSSRSVTQISAPITGAHSRQSQDQGQSSQVPPGDNSSGFKTTVFKTMNQLLETATDAWRGDGDSGGIGEGEHRENDGDRGSPSTSVHAPPQLSAPATDKLGRQSSISQSFASLSIHDGLVEGLIGSQQQQQQQQGFRSAQIPPAIPFQTQISQAAYMESFGNHPMNSGMGALRNLQSPPQALGNQQQQGSYNPLGSQPLNHDDANSFMAPGNHGCNIPQQNSNSHFAVHQNYGTNTFASPQYNGNARPYHNDPNAAGPQLYNVNPAAIFHNFNAPAAPQNYNVNPAAVPRNLNAPAAPFLINPPANLNHTPPNFSSFIRSTQESYTQSLAQDKASLEAQKAALQAYHQGLKDREKDRRFAFLENVCRNARLGETEI
ncbi:hypothetical protein ACHAO8_011311 [Botrytis cinerea]